MVMLFRTALEVLEDARKALIQQLRRQSDDPHAHADALAQKVEIDSAIELLTLLSKHDAGPRFSVTELPPPLSDGSEYRIMEDQETDDRAAWTELIVQGSPVRPSPRALVVESRGK